jgi:hypothetical protein
MSHWSCRPNWSTFLTSPLAVVTAPPLTPVSFARLRRQLHLARVGAPNLARPMCCGNRRLSGCLFSSAGHCSRTIDRTKWVDPAACGPRQAMSRRPCMPGLALYASRAKQVGLTYAGWAAKPVSAQCPLGLKNPFLFSIRFKFKFKL